MFLKHCSTSGSLTVDERNSEINIIRSRAFTLISSFHQGHQLVSLVLSVTMRALRCFEKKSIALMDSYKTVAGTR